MDSEDIHALFKKYKGKNAKYDKFVSIIKADGIFNIRVKECEGIIATN